MNNAPPTAKNRRQYMTGTCSVSTWLSSLDETTRNTAGELLNLQLSNSKLFQYLNASDPALPFKLTAFKDHRKGRCICQ